MVVVAFIFIVILVICISMSSFVIPVLVVFIGSAPNLRLRILLGIANRKLLMGSRPAAPKRIWNVGLFGVVFGGRRIVILKIQGI